MTNQTERDAMIEAFNNTHEIKFRDIDKNNARLASDFVQLTRQVDFFDGWQSATAYERAKVVEECAKVCERMFDTHNKMIDDCCDFADEIRALQSKGE